MNWFLIFQDYSERQNIFVRKKNLFSIVEDDLENSFLNLVWLQPSASPLHQRVLYLDVLPLLPLDEPLPGSHDLHLRLVGHEGRQRAAEDGDDGEDRSDAAGPDHVVHVDGQEDEVHDGVGQNEDGGDDGGADGDHFRALRFRARQRYLTGGRAIWMKDETIIYLMGDRNPL